MINDTPRRVAPPVFRPRPSLPRRVWQEAALQVHVYTLLVRLALHDSLSVFSRALEAFYGVLDAHVFPRILAYTTHRMHIAFMALVWLALLLGGAWTTWELVGGNYTNGLSALMTCIIALNQVHHRRENQAHHAATQALQEQVDALHAKVDSKKR